MPAPGVVGAADVDFLRGADAATRSRRSQVFTTPGVQMNTWVLAATVLERGRSGVRPSQVVISRQRLGRT
jgi:hypothetical protein